MSHLDNPRLEIVPMVPKRAETLLDVGCANGSFALALKASRPALIVDGVEPVSEAAGAARAHMRLVYEGTFPEVMPTGAQYDCITFLDSLEHMVDPWEALRAASQFLRRQGSVIASLPNVRHVHALSTLLWAKDWPHDDQNIFDRTHLRWFTRKSMLRIFEDCGYAVERIEPINVWSDAKTRVLSKLLGADIAATQYALVAKPL